MNVLDLFSGIGGFSLGLESVGMRTIGFCEIEPFCRAVLAKHWPGVPIFEDIRKLDHEALAPLGTIDLVCGGVPCQPASVAGKRQGSSDARWLWPDFLRVVREVRPRWVVAENVLGIVELKPHGLDWVCCELEAAGYGVWPVVVGADDIGAPHRRKRVWIVGRLADAGHVHGREDEPGRGPEGGTSSWWSGASELDNSDAGRRGREGDEVQAGRDEPERPASGVSLADPYRGRPQGEWEQNGDASGNEHGQPSRHHADGHGERPVGDTERAGLQKRHASAFTGQEKGGDSAESTPWWFSAPRWPARPGEPQHEWEEPRLVAYAKGVGRPGEGSGRVGQEQGTGAPDHGPRGAGAYGAAVAEPGRREVGGRTGAAAEPRSSELPMGCSAHGLPERLARRANREALKALGNSVVPQVVYAIGKAILAVEASVTAPHAGEGER